jgi:hypothetical protein
LCNACQSNQHITRTSHDKVAWLPRESAIGPPVSRRMARVSRADFRSQMQQGPDLASMGSTRYCISYGVHTMCLQKAICTSSLTQSIHNGRCGIHTNADVALKCETRL